MSDAGGQHGETLSSGVPDQAGSTGRRGRSRSTSAWVAILEATRDELAVRGYDRLSIDRIAAAAGVGKQTVYRWYPSKSSLVAECILRGYVITPEIVVEDTGDLRRDLRSWLERFSAGSREPAAVALIRAGTAAAAEDPEVAARYGDITKATEEALIVRLRAGVALQQVDAGASLSAAAEMLVGALLYRVLTRQDLDADFTGALVDVVLLGLDGTRGP